MDQRDRTLLYGGAVITPDGPRYDWAVKIERSKILAVGPYRFVKSYNKKDERRIYVRGRIIAPGFVDVQINGAAGHLLTGEPTVETVRAMAAILPRFGCTGFLPTIITAPLERMEAAARAVATAMDEPTNGARILGIHLEGPFINPERAGAHQRDAILAPSVDVLHRLWEASGRSARLLTLAPELPGAADVIAEARRLGIAVSIGHTTADFAQVNEAARQGATLVTHLFNAMSPLGSRQPGTVGAALSNDAVAVSLIADGVHVHPASLKIAARAKQNERVVLITDAMSPLGTDMRSFELYGETIVVRDGSCYRSDGVLAGSVLSMDHAVRNMQQLTGVEITDGLVMASSNPTRIIGLADITGSLEPGLAADIVICDDEANVWLTMVEGQICYRAPEK